MPLGSQYSLDEFLLIHRPVHMVSIPEDAFGQNRNVRTTDPRRYRTKLDNRLRAWLLGDERVSSLREFFGGDNRQGMV